MLLLKSSPCRLAARSLYLRSLRPSRTIQRGAAPDVDDLGLPTSPTWSVNQLLSSYPTPTLAPGTLVRLHELAALVPPPDGSPEFSGLSRELGELIRLVEAVKLVHVDRGSGDDGIPDARLWQEGKGIDLFVGSKPKAGETKRHESNVVGHAEQSEDGYYVVETSRRKSDTGNTADS